MCQTVVHTYIIFSNDAISFDDENCFEYYQLERPSLGNYIIKIDEKQIFTFFISKVK